MMVKNPPNSHLDSPMQQAYHQMVPKGLRKPKKGGQFFSTIATIDLKNHSTLEVKVKALCLHSCSGLLLPNAPLREPTLKSAHRRGRENH